MNKVPVDEKRISLIEGINMSRNSNKTWKLIRSMNKEN